MISRKLKTVEERLLAKRLIDPETGCWIWTGALKREGSLYGTIGLNYKNYPTHRIAAWLWKGFYIESKAFVCHHCDNTKCFNPEHLFIGTASDNTKDMILKGRNKVLRGVEQPNAKFSKEEVLEIDRLRAEGLFYKDIGVVMGCSRETARAIHQRKRYKDVERKRS